MQIEIYRRPTGPVFEEITAITMALTGEWFTEDVLPALARDLLFHDVVCAKHDGRIRAFLMYTSHDGAIHISLMGTSPEYRGRGFGSALMNRLELQAKGLGFDRIVAFTVPPSSKPAYQATVDFYRKCGFKLVKKYTELWQSGAWEFRKLLNSE